MSNLFIETDRLILRELQADDREGFFRMDSDPAVHRYLYQSPIQTIEEADEAILFIQSQYQQYGTGRLAVLDRETNAFLGWAGIKFIEGPMNGLSNFYEIGYRFAQRYWGKGYATEATKAIVAYGFQQFQTDAFYAITDIDNQGSRKVLEKSGFQYEGNFDLEGLPVTWYVLSREDWAKQFG